MRFATFAVAQQHDLRAIKLITEVFEMSHQYGSIAFSLLVLVDHKIFENGVRLESIHGIQTKR